MKQERCSFKQQRCTFIVRFLPPLLRVDSFATYAYSRRICLLDFFIVFKPKNSKKIPVGICDSYTRMLQMNPPYLVVNEILLTKSRNATDIWMREIWHSHRLLCFSRAKDVHSWHVRDSPRAECNQSQTDVLLTVQTCAIWLNQSELSFCLSCSPASSVRIHEFFTFKKFFFCLVM